MPLIPRCVRGTLYTLMCVTDAGKLFHMSSSMWLEFPCVSIPNNSNFGSRQSSERRKSRRFLCDCSVICSVHTVMHSMTSELTVVVIGMNPVPQSMMTSFDLLEFLSAIAKNFCMPVPFPSYLHQLNCGTVYGMMKSGVTEVRKSTLLTKCPPWAKSSIFPVEGRLCPERRTTLFIISIFLENNCHLGNGFPKKHLAPVSYAWGYAKKN